jgi:hypothetical protein
VSPTNSARIHMMQNVQSPHQAFTKPSHSNVNYSSVNYCSGVHAVHSKCVRTVHVCHHLLPSKQHPTVVQRLLLPNSAAAAAALLA